MNYDITRYREKSITVREYMDKWLYLTKQPCLKPASFDRLEMLLKHQIYPSIGDKPISSVNSDDIQKAVNDIAAAMSYSTAKKTYNYIGACLRTAVLRGLINQDPTQLVVMPKKNKVKEISVYNTDEIKKIVETATATYKNGKYIYRYGYAVILMLNTGMRVGELLYLKWKDVDLDKRRIYIHGNVVCVKDRSSERKTSYKLLEQDTPKTSRSVRYIPLNENAVNALEKLKAAIGSDTRVVAAKTGSIVSPRKIYHVMRKILERSGVYGCCDVVHALRHTFATALIRSGTDVKVVSEILGHSEVSTTFQIYYHTIEELKHNAVEHLDNIY